MDLDAIGLQSNFSTIDWVIVVAYLLGTVAIGFYANRFIANMADYVVAGRALRSCLAIATMVGSELGLVTVMYSAQKGFTGGFAAFHIGLAAGVVWFSEHTRPGRERLAWVEAQIAELESKTDENEKFLKFMDEIHKFDEQHVWVDVLHDIISSLPSHEELVLAGVKMDQEEGEVTLKTEAANRDTATKAIDSLVAFRREGCKKQRFKVSMGAQTEKKGQDYPYQQDLKVEILDDEPDEKGSQGSSRRRGG